MEGDVEGIKQIFFKLLTGRDEFVWIPGLPDYFLELFRQLDRLEDFTEFHYGVFKEFD